MLQLGDLPDLRAAACKGMDSYIFFGDHVCGPECDETGCNVARGEQGRLKRIKYARSICASCPVMEECRQWAIDTRQPFGVWGGTTERERRIIITKTHTKE